MIFPKDRINTLRQRCFERKIHLLHYPIIAIVDFFKQVDETQPFGIQCGLRTQYVLGKLKFEIDDLELLAGRPSRQQIHADTHSLEESYRYLRENNLPYCFSIGHCELDVSKLFELGIDGLITRIKGFPQNDTRKGFIIALEGFSQMIENLAKTVEAEITSASAGRQRELNEIAMSCHNIAHHPPADFRDAIQLLWLVDLAVMYGENASLVVPGHLDRTLWPYYQKDIQSGKLDKTKALELIESLYILINETIPNGLAMSVMIGGKDIDENDVTNELSYLCMEAVRKTKMVYPTVGVCWSETTPDDLVDLTVELISKGYTTPAFLGDETICKGLEYYGLTREESCNYINSTCVEITPVGSSNVWIASPYFNLCKWLLEELGCQAVMPSANFEKFLDSYIKRAADGIKQAVDEKNTDRRQRSESRVGSFLQSVLTRDCIERGKDIDNGGALHNWVECSFVGLANLADSLFVIKQEIFMDRNMTLNELKNYLDSDFEDAEELRLRFLNGYPKYGQANEEVDTIVKNIINRLISECHKHKMFPYDSPYIPGTFCWIMHEHLGRETGATPDGRRAGFPFADGGGPAQGRETCGPTAGILSTTSWDHSPMIGGLAYNMKFSSQLFKASDGKKLLKELILTYLRKGGFETQINVIDRETLLKAQKNPEEYSDLVVRIGGYCDYFVKLSPEMQAEVLLRTEFNN